MAKPAKCTLGPRHKWAFINNVIIRRGWPGHWQISKRGMYRCECGEKKYGNMDMNVEAKP